jgi:hypothetical protein
LVVEDGVDSSGAEVPTSQRTSAAIPSDLQQSGMNTFLQRKETPAL